MIKMPESENLIDFEIIESQKENIQSLPGGHSARALANIFSPSPLQRLPTPSDSKNLNDVMRQEFESELANISESDDPLDIYDRYVRWTLDAYPSAQATPSSQLLPLLERATRAFINSAQYKNDPRYLKLWISYIKLVSDAPRETFAFLARHGIGKGLALFYEEFAIWFEEAGRWNQAEEIFRTGIEKEAIPTARLLRKFEEFQARAALRPTDIDQPSSPALPVVRPALAAKSDPYAVPVFRDPQAPKPNPGVGGTSKSRRQKLQIFSDEDNIAPAVASGGDAVGWQSIGSLAERKKENNLESKPWVGETLKAEGKKSSTKIAVFKDESQSQSQFTYPQVTDPAQHQVTVNQGGKTERIFVNLEALYPTPNIFGSELSIEELRADYRGWLSKVWKPEITNRQILFEPSHSKRSSDESLGVNHRFLKRVSEKLTINGPVLDENCMVKEPSIGGQARKMRIKEINETQISPRMSKRKPKEPTMTLHTKAAIDDIFELFSQPLKPPEDGEDEEENTDDDMTDGDYTSGGESTATGRLVGTSETGDYENSDSKSVSEWSEFTARRHIPHLENTTEILSSRTDTDRDDEDYEPYEIENQNLAEKRRNVISNLPELSTMSESIFPPALPNNCEAPTQPYRDPTQISQNRLPFMTPIAEKTESSLGMATIAQTKNYLKMKTPSKEPSTKRLILTGSHFEEIASQTTRIDKITQPLPHSPEQTRCTAPITVKSVVNLEQNLTDIIPKKAIVNDAKCNPTDGALREAILSGLEPPLDTYEGFYNYGETYGGKTAEIRKYVKAKSKSHRKANEKSTANLPISPTLQFPGTNKNYLLRRELGAGTFAPVYLIEKIEINGDDAEAEGKLPQKTMISRTTTDVNRPSVLEALKMEHKPSPWEFYVIRQSRYRLCDTRAADSVINVYEMHIFKDESYLTEEFRNQGTLLDIINIAKSDKSGPGVMDEVLAMFFTIELFRTIETLHVKGILHGDLKADNCLVRFDPLSEAEVWSTDYRKDGSAGWNKKGICLIDFGRGIDMRVFSPNVQFIADWESGPQDCAEIREMRPWTYQIDYHGLTGIIHSMLFGKYIDTVADNRDGIGPGARKTWRLRENLKRYWQTELWAEAFDLLLNPVSHVEGEEGSKMPLTQSMKACREKMESWLEANSERGVGLQGLIRKIETHLARKK